VWCKKKINSKISPINISTFTLFMLMDTFTLHMLLTIILYSHYILYYIYFHIYGMYIALSYVYYFINYTYIFLCIKWISFNIIHDSIMLYIYHVFVLSHILHIYCTNLMNINKRTCCTLHITKSTSFVHSAIKIYIYIHTYIHTYTHTHTLVEVNIFSNYQKIFNILTQYSHSNDLNIIILCVYPKCSLDLFSYVLCMYQPSYW
jgi:hypothetical protein